MTTTPRLNRHAEMTQSSVVDAPDFDFRTLPLCKDSRAQLANTYDHVQRSGGVPKQKGKLLGHIITHAFDRRRGLYLPVSDHVQTFRKFNTEISSQIAAGDTRPLRFPSRASYFTNALLIPEGYGNADFDLGRASAPIHRATNCGLLVVTLEVDCESREEFEQNLAWTRGNDEDFRNAPFAQVDRDLCRFEDYRGHCIVFTGNRSLHFHLIFSIEHLLNCPADALADARWSQNWIQQAALICKAHGVYWDRSAEMFRERLGSDIQFDETLRTFTQWRRTPWAMRVLEKDSEILGLSKGTEVPQIVLHEDIRTRAPRGSSEFCVPETFSVADPVHIPAKRSATAPNLAAGEMTAIVAELQRMCASEWGEYPKPVSIGDQNGEWLIRFRNHPDDKSPSTIVLGNHRKLVLGGDHSFDGKSFFLPGGLTAKELCIHLEEMFGLGSTAVPSSSPDATASQSEQQPPGSFGSMRNFHHQVSAATSRSFRLSITDDLKVLKQAYRRKLGEVVSGGIRVLRRFPILIKSAEGIGKTSAHVPVLVDEILDRALSIGKANPRLQLFAAFAFRSKDQAEAKADEVAEILKARDAENPYMRDLPILRRTFFVRPFRDHYETACRKLGVKPIEKEGFEELGLDSLLQQISHEQPDVYELLEETRKSLWADARFDAGVTILFMTHKSAEHWREAINTRAWHHPDFTPEMGMKEAQRLAREFLLADVVFDDPEADEFLHLISESLHDFLAKQQEKHRDWRNLPLSGRRDIYRHAAKDIPGQQIKGFDDFDELMRLDLRGLQPLAVDYVKIPYGQDNPEAKGIYKRRDGDRYYLGPKPWLARVQRWPQMVFLTTEDGVANVIEKAFAGDLIRLDLDNMPGVFPISIPFYADKRAKAEEISELAAEIRAANETAIIIGDGIKAPLANTYTFQKMKGLNGMEDRDVFVIVTWLSPEKYAELNVLGQWLGREDVIAIHYRDQINQAVGRNRGFRHSAKVNTKTTVVASLGLWSRFLDMFMRESSRTRLCTTKERPW